MIKNFEPPVEKATEEQLLNWVNTTGAEFASLASDELTRRDLRELNHSVKEFDKASSKYSDKIFILTFVMFAVALAQLMVGVFSIPFSLPQGFPIPVEWIRLVIWLLILGFIMWEIHVLTKKRK